MGKWFNLVTCLEFPSSKQRNDDGFQIAAVCRTKQWMASKEYSETLLLYPRYLALDRLPLGLPSGVSSSANGLEKSTLAHQKFSFDICACFLLLTCWQMKIIAIPHIKWFLSTWIQFPICPPHAGIADKREISVDQRKHLEKFLPAFRFQLFGLERTADFLESWLDGTYERSKLLDVSACLSSRTWMSTTKFKIDGNSSFQILFMIVTESFSPFFLEFLSLFLISFLSLSLSTRYAGAWSLRDLMSFAPQPLHHSPMHSALNPTFSGCLYVIQIHCLLPQASRV